jgi:hypothetical protein
MTTTNLLRFVLEGFASADWVYTVSHYGCQPLRLYSAEAVRFLRLQTMIHSILSTRIVLHTGRVLRKGDADTQLPTRCRIGSQTTSVELELLINEDT